MASFPRALPFPIPVPARVSIIALLALIALLRQAEAYTEPPIPDGCVAEIAEVDREAMRAVYAALPKMMFFWHDGIPQYKLFDDSHNVSYCCVAPKPANVSCRLWCPLECTTAGRITGIFSDPSRQDMPGPVGSGGSCPPGALSPAIGDLAELSSLVFRHSCLAGGLPDSVTRLQKLTEIVMPENNLSGPIPPGLFRLPALRHVDLSTISTNPEFQLQYEGLSGSLPDGPDAYSSSLEEVILLSGAIPPALAEMTALQKLDLGGNRLSGAVPAALRDSESLKALDEVRLDNNVLSGAFCDALLPARELWLGFNDLGGATTGSSASASGGGEGGGSLHGCVFPAKLVRLSAPHAGLRGSVPLDLFLATNAQTGRRLPMGGLDRFVQMDLSHNSLSGSLKAFTVLPRASKLDLSHNNFSGGIPEAFFTRLRADLRFNDLWGPLFDANLESRSSRFSSYDWDLLRVSNNSARMAGDVGAGYLPVPAPGLQASAAETTALLAVRDALLGEAAGAAGGKTALVNGGSSSWAEILRSWDASSSSACAWYGVGCTADGHVDTLHLIGASNVTLHPNFVPKSPECEYDQYGEMSCAHDVPPPPPQVQFFLRGLPGGSASAGSAVASRHLSEALGQLTQLTSLRISGHALSSGLPSSLSRLSHLVALDLSSNRHLSGSIPPALFALPSLRELSLRGNNLTGAVLPSTTAAAPAALSASLEILDLGGNGLLGSIAAQVCLLTGLTRLALDHNRLDGSLPRELGALWMLTDLQLQGNALQGDVSALAAAFPPPCCYYRRWQHRRLCCLHSNQLSGDAAALFPRDQQFHTLNLSNNQLTWGPGSNASWHADYLDLSHNRISAPLQDLFGDLSKRFYYSTVLRLSHNQLSGPIPAPLLGRRVTQELDLSHNLLTGSIPAIDNLYSKTLDLSHNQLTGTIPQLDGTDRLRLSYLDLSSNKLTGSISNALGQQRLGYLDLSFNAFTGTVAESNFPCSQQQSAATTGLAGASGAEVRLHHNELTGRISGFVFSSCVSLLDLSHNQLSGPVPDPPQGSNQSSSLVPLSHLDLSSNKLTGNISDALVTVLTALSHLDLSENLLSGSVPRSLALAPVLTHLDLSHNQLSGPIPDPPQGNSRSSSLVPLSYLDLSSNKFTGNISDALVTGLTALSHLDLSDNLLSGSLPRSLTLAPALTDLNLSRNKLKGSLPAFCQGKQRLSSLLLSSNAFSGPLSSSLLPSSSSSCASSLLSLNVSSNQLSGSLPEPLSRFTALHSLLAARNRMSGSIPAGLASLTGLQELDVSWSGLSGTIPARLCAAAPSLQVHLAGNALSGSVPPSLSDLPTSYFRPGNPKLCGKPLPDCKKRSAKPRKGRVPALCALFSAPYALRPMLGALCTAPHALRPMLCAQCSAPNALRPMLCAPCSAPHALRPMLCAPCSAPYALRPMLCAPCSAPYALFPMLCALCSAPHALRPMLYAHGPPFLPLISASPHFPPCFTSFPSLLHLISLTASPHFPHCFISFPSLLHLISLPASPHFPHCFTSFPSLLHLISLTA
ncbi:unnamed protein product [Closterium sp. NIES-65]|nr:unnamed protein product [Closterium sp. NIES-65]